MSLCFNYTGKCDRSNSSDSINKYKAGFYGLRANTEASRLSVISVYFPLFAVTLTVYSSTAAGEKKRETAE